MIENILLEELPNIYRYFKNAADNAATGKQADKMKLYALVTDMALSVLTETKDVLTFLEAELETSNEYANKQTLNKIRNILLAQLEW